MTQSINVLELQTRLETLCDKFNEEIGNAVQAATSAKDAEIAKLREELKDADIAIKEQKEIQEESNKQITQLEAELVSHAGQAPVAQAQDNGKVAELEGRLAKAKTIFREMKTEMDSLKANQGSGDDAALREENERLKAELKAMRENIPF